jgi:hypothetical protein
VSVSHHCYHRPVALTSFYSRYFGIRTGGPGHYDGTVRPFSMHRTQLIPFQGLVRVSWTHVRCSCPLVASHSSLHHCYEIWSQDPVERERARASSRLRKVASFMHIYLDITINCRPSSRYRSLLDQNIEPIHQDSHASL